VALLHRGRLVDIGNPNDVLTETQLEQTYGVKLKIADVAPGLRVCVPLLN
jgi:ABC-type cobalamin transport system ATPase subunit